MLHQLFNNKEQPACFLILNFRALMFLYQSLFIDFSETSKQANTRGGLSKTFLALYTIFSIPPLPLPVQWMHPFKTIDLAFGHFGWSDVVNSLIPLDLDVRWCWIISFQAPACYFLRLKCEVTSRVWLACPHYSLGCTQSWKMSECQSSFSRLLSLAAHMNINTSL